MSRARIGEIYKIALDAESVQYFQYVADDTTQMNSQVIRVFHKKYLVNEGVSLRDLVASQIAFECHTNIEAGVKMKVFQLCGKTNASEKVSTVFSTSDDDGNLSIEISKRWWVWEINSDPIFVGGDVKKLIGTEYGSVFPATAVLDRLKTGEYGYRLPRYV